MVRIGIEVVSGFGIGLGLGLGLGLELKLGFLNGFKWVEIILGFK